MGHLVLYYIKWILNKLLYTIWKLLGWICTSNGKNCLIISSNKTMCQIEILYSRYIFRETFFKNNEIWCCSELINRACVVTRVKTFLNRLEIRLKWLYKVFGKRNSVLKGLIAFTEMTKKCPTNKEPESNLFDVKSIFIIY